MQVISGLKASVTYPQNSAFLSVRRILYPQALIKEDIAVTL